eukprot:521160-Rhodomonas_salina.1
MRFLVLDFGVYAMAGADTGMQSEVQHKLKDLQVWPSFHSWVSCLHLCHPPPLYGASAPIYGLSGAINGGVASIYGSGAPVYGGSSAVHGGDGDEGGCTAGGDRQRLLQSHSLRPQ